jgi:hypothetical protein
MNSSTGNFDPTAENSVSETSSTHLKHTKSLEQYSNNGREQTQQIPTQTQQMQQGYGQIKIERDKHIVVCERSKTKNWNLKELGLEIVSNGDKLPGLCLCLSILFLFIFDL